VQFRQDRDTLGGNCIAMQSGQFHLGVVILAAGSSQRMGRPKLLLPWGRTSVLGHLIQQWTALMADQIAVVCAADALALQHELDRLDFPACHRILNPRPDRGMFGSVQCAAGWSGWRDELTHWVIALGDQPHLGQATLQELITLAMANPGKVCHPLRAGRPKHPVLLPRRPFIELRDSPSPHLKHFLAGQTGEQLGFDSSDAGLDYDLDTPEDYEQLRKRFL
jgi:molybdenum cofactor cytidylyltransferase